MCLSHYQYVVNDAFYYKVTVFSTCGKAGPVYTPPPLPRDKFRNFHNRGKVVPVTKLDCRRPRQLVCNSTRTKVK